MENASFVATKPELVPPPMAYNAPPVAATSEPLWSGSGVCPDQLSVVGSYAHSDGLLKKYAMPLIAAAAPVTFAGRDAFTLQVFEFGS